MIIFVCWNRKMEKNSEVNQIWNFPPLNEDVYFHNIGIANAVLLDKICPSSSIFHQVFNVRRLLYELGKWGSEPEGDLQPLSKKK